MQQNEEIVWPNWPSYVVPAHQTSDMLRCTISAESHLKLEMVIFCEFRLSY